MNELENLAENNYDGANGEALRNLDIISVQDHMLKQQYKLEETQYLLENAEDWIDEIVDVVIEKALAGYLDTDVLDDVCYELKDELLKKAREQINER